MGRIFWYKKLFNTKHQTIYYEDSSGYWEKYQYNNVGRMNYYENSFGEVEDKRWVLSGENS
jgi:hypothetical protein